MTKKLTITEITEHFQQRVKYLTTPPQKWDLDQVLKLLEQDNYNQLLFDYGEIYCLIVLDMFETWGWFEACAEVLKQINTHNYVNGTKFKTRLNQINIK